MTLAFHLGLLHDHRRLEAWAAAIAHNVGPDDVVIDFGAGFGPLSIFAARQGARVYAVEREEAGAHIKTFAAHHGVADRISVLRGDSVELAPTERGTLAIFDDVDALDLGGSAVRTLKDARARWLVDDARLLPSSITLKVALAGSGLSLPDRVAGLETMGLGAARLGPQQRKLTDAGQLMSAPIEVGRGPPDVLGDGGLDVGGVVTSDRDGPVAGLLMWPSLQLGDTLLDAGPHPTPVAYPQVFFPFASPLRAAAGDRCTIALQQHRSAANGGEHQMWRWEAVIGKQRADGSTFAAGALDAVLAGLRSS
jgi:hypothetical protein